MTTQSYLDELNADELRALVRWLASGKLIPSAKNIHYWITFERSKLKGDDHAA